MATCLHDIRIDQHRPRLLLQSPAILAMTQSRFELRPIDSIDGPLAFRNVQERWIQDSRPPAVCTGNFRTFSIKDAKGIGKLDRLV